MDNLVIELFLLFFTFRYVFFLYPRIPASKRPLLLLLLLFFLCNFFNDVFSLFLVQTSNPALWRRRSLSWLRLSDNLDLGTCACNRCRGCYRCRCRRRLTGHRRSSRLARRLRLAGGFARRFRPRHGGTMLRKNLTSRRRRTSKARETRRRSAHWQWLPNYVSRRQRLARRLQSIDILSQPESRLFLGSRRR